MKVILLKDIPRLGQRNDVKDVADGYARNFLFPLRLAAPATAAAQSALAAAKAQTNAERRENDATYRAAIARIAETPIEITIKAGERGKAFGAVTAPIIQNALRKEKIFVEKNWIKIEQPIKTTGEHAVRIHFPSGDEANARLIIRPE